MFYKNTSYSVKTFYGVTFEPGQTQEVDNYINDKFMILVDGPVDSKVIHEEVQQKPSPVKPKKDVKKVEEVSTEEAVLNIEDSTTEETKKSK